MGVKYLSRSLWIASLFIVFAPSETLCWWHLCINSLNHILVIHINNTTVSTLHSRLASIVQIFSLRKVVLMKHRISAVGLGNVNWLTRQRCKIFCLRAAIWRSLTILEILRIHAPSSTCQLNRGTHRSLNTKDSSQPLYQAVYSTNPHWQENTRAPQSEKGYT